MRSAKGRNHRLGQAGEAARVADPSRVDGLRPWAGPRISAKGSESGARLPRPSLGRPECVRFADGDCDFLVRLTSASVGQLK